MSISITLKILLGGMSLLAGVSYIMNVAGPDTLQDEVNQVDDYVGERALYMVAEYRMFSFGTECPHGKYDDNNRNSDGNVEDSRDAVTLQLAVEF